MGSAPAIEARRLISKRRASLLSAFAILFVAAAAWSQSVAEYRVAAIIDAGPDSKALVESADGNQSWYESGDSIGDARVTQIDKDGVTIVHLGTESRLSLRGDAMFGETLGSSDVASADVQTKRFQFRNLLSVVNSVTQQHDETTEQATARHLNRTLGLVADAKITSVGGVEVTTAKEAHAELSARLLNDQFVRIFIDNSPTNILYVMPSE